MKMDGKKIDPGEGEGPDRWNSVCVCQGRTRFGGLTQSGVYVAVRSENERRPERLNQ